MKSILPFLYLYVIKINNQMSNKFHKISNEDALAFILGGKAKFTFKSLNTGVDFSFEVKDAKDKFASAKAGKTVYNPNFKFVSLFIGANQAVRGRAYAYFGTISRTKNNWGFNIAAKNQLRNENPAITAFSFVFNRLLNGVQLPTLEIWHEGRCCCCGRALKLSESIELGWGTVCLGHRQGMREQLESDIAQRKLVAQTTLNEIKNKESIVAQVIKGVKLPQGNLFSSIPDLVPSKNKK